MKVASTILISALAAKQVIATWDLKAPSYGCPANTDNQCDDDEQAGFDWSDLIDGQDVGSYKGYDFGGFKCSSKPNKRDNLTKRTFQDKCITGTITKNKSNGPKISCPSKQFSVDEIQVTVDYDVDVEFHYGMPDGTTCKQVSPCQAGGTIVKNTQCGGAQDVSFQIPDTNDKEDCGIGFHSVGFYCNTATPPAYTPTPEPTPTPTPSAVETIPTSAPPVVSTSVVEIPSSIFTPPAEVSTTVVEVSSSIFTLPAEVPTTVVDISSSILEITTSTIEVPSSVFTPPAETLPVSTAACESGGYGIDCGEVPPVTSAVEIGSSVIVSSVVETSAAETTAAPPAETPYLPIPEFSSSIVEVPSSIVITSEIVASSSLLPVETPVETPDVPLPDTTVVPDIPATTIVPETSAAPIMSSALVVVPSSVVTPNVPVPTANCPNELQRCLNTWIFSINCKDNTDASCYCKSKDFVTQVINCVPSWATSDQVVQEALSYFVGICAPYIPENPAIITACPPAVTLAPPPAVTPAPPAETPVIPPVETPSAIAPPPADTLIPGITITAFVPTTEVPAVPVPSSVIVPEQSAITPAPPAATPAYPVTTITVSQVVTVPCAACSVAEGSPVTSSTLSTYITIVTVPQVAFTTETVPAAPGATQTQSVNLVPGTPAPVPANPTSVLQPTSFGTVTRGSGTATGTPPATFTGAASHIEAGKLGLVAGAVIALFAI